MSFTCTLKSITELKAGLSFFLVVGFDALMYRVSACKPTRHHLRVTAIDRTDPFEVCVGWAKAVSVVPQWYLTIVLRTAWVTDANYNGTLFINYRDTLDYRCVFS